MRAMLLGLMLALVLVTAMGCTTPGCPSDPSIRCFFGWGYGDPPPGAAPKRLPEVQQDEPTAEPPAEAPTDVLVVEVTEAPPVVEQPPVVIVDPATSERLTWRDLGLYALVAVVVISICIVAYRLTTMVGMSYPPGTSEAMTRARAKASEVIQRSPNKLDDLGLFLSEPVINAIIEEIAKREKAAASAPPGESLG